MTQAKDAEEKELTLKDVGDKVDHLSGEVDRLSGEFDELSGKVDKLSGEFDKLSGKVDKLSTEVERFNTRFSDYQQATQWVVQLAFALIVSATVTVIVSAVFVRR